MRSISTRLRILEFYTANHCLFHPNALTFLATLSDGDKIAETYYSVGGGLVKREGETESSRNYVVFCHFLSIHPKTYCTGAGKLVSSICYEVVMEMNRPGGRNKKRGRVSWRYGM